MYHIKTLLFSFCSGDIYLFSDSHFMPQSSGSFQGIGENNQCHVSWTPRFCL